MCGIVGAVAQRNVVPILLEGLQRLEYRGYDSAGLVVVRDGELERVRSTGRVADLTGKSAHTLGNLGIAHTRWATHGVPSERNAHPHISKNRIAVVHNGIIENYEALRTRLTAEGYEFSSDTDTEVIAHLIHSHYARGNSLLGATQAALAELVGAYAIGVIAADDPEQLICARRGSPLLLGIGNGEYFIASDVSALLPVTRNVVYLEEGDVVELGRKGYQIFDATGKRVVRAVQVSELSNESVQLGEYQHYMQKEIHEQPQALADTLESVCNSQSLVPGIFGAEAAATFAGIDSILILACGTSYHAGLVARYWLEEISGIRCNVEVASEYRYRVSVPNPKSLVVVISQSGETADTQAALNHARQQGHIHTLAICNVPESALVRLCKLRFLTRAGPEIGVASTKAFTTQLAALFLLTLVLAKQRGRLTAEQEQKHLHELRHLPSAVQKVLELEPQIARAGRAVRGQASRAVPGARPALSDRAGRRAQAQGDLVYPCRSLSGRRAEARTAGAGGQVHAGDLGRAQRCAAGKAEVQPAGSARARRRAVCVRRCAYAYPRSRRHPHHADARTCGIPEPHPAHHPAAIAGLLRRPAKRHRCGQAEESREVGDG